MFLFSKAGGCFRNYSARKKTKTCCSWLTSSKLKTWAAFSIKGGYLSRICQVWFSHIRIPFRDKLKVSVAGIQVQMTPSWASWNLGAAFGWQMREISHSSGFFYLKIFLCTSHSIGARGCTSLHLHSLELLYDKYHHIFYVTTFFLG